MAGSEIIRLVTWSYMSAITSNLILSAERISFVGWCGITQTKLYIVHHSMIRAIVHA